MAQRRTYLAGRLWDIASGPTDGQGLRATLLLLRGPTLSTSTRDHTRQMGPPCFTIR
uniref:Uncharacterized protein n=1 Tax=uncultured marine virus TaxID=186617 RepID=A0A0F7L989_9VIRU|nr:hypothetical protein [uncultured marine virus]